MENKGIVTVSSRAIAQIAVHAIKKCDGVSGMSDKSGAREATRKMSGNNGVYVMRTKQGIVLDLYVACTHGTDARALSGAVGTAVKDAFPCTGIEIKDVAVHINDVR